jgi:hypothetical protein
MFLRGKTLVFILYLVPCYIFIGTNCMFLLVLFHGFWLMALRLPRKELLNSSRPFKTPFCMCDQPARDILKMVAKTTIRTKVVALYFIYKQMYTYPLIVVSRWHFDYCSRLILAGMSDCKTS